MLFDTFGAPISERNKMGRDNEQASEAGSGEQIEAAREGSNGNGRVAQRVCGNELEP